MSINHHLITHSYLNKLNTKEYKQLNISNLSEGQTLKNYKELCTILDIPIKGGKGKQIQLNELSRHCIYSKQGQKIIINELLTEPLAKVDHRKDIDKEGNNSKYVEHVKILLLNILLQCEDYTYTLTKNKWLELLGMVNRMYLDKDISRMILFKRDLNIKDYDINHFYFRTNGQLTRILYDSFNSLKRKYLIKYRELNIVVRLDDSNKEIHTEANKDEELLILHAKYTALADMGLNSLIQVVLKFKMEEYNTKVDKELNKHNIKYCYKQIEIIFNKDNVLRELSSMNVIKQHKQELNNKIIDIINQNARKTYYKNEEEYNTKLDGFLYNDDHLGHCKPKDSFSMFRHKDNYLDIQMELADYFIKLELL